MNNFDVADLLKGLKPIKDRDGNIVVQTIGNMQLVCLTADEEFSINRFANPMTVVGSNRSYGHLKLRNKSSDPMIVPGQIAVMTKRAAQNHAMVKAAYVPANNSADFEDAGCVQGSQTGYLNEADNEIRMLPFGAREYVLSKVNETGGHSNVYDSITKVGSETGANSGTYLDKYFSAHDKKLAEFIAHFERLPNTIGTIVLVDGEIVGVDKFPSYEYTAQIWDVLIRDCYASIAITEERKGKGSKDLFTKTMSKNRKKSDETNTQFLRRMLLKTKSNIGDGVKERIQEVIDLSMTAKKDRDVDGYKSFILSAEGYSGQVIMESDHNHLVSIVKKGAFNPERMRKANVMRTLAKKQTKFSL